MQKTQSSQFKDHFSSQSSNYQNFRPSYPDTLFKYLSSLAPETNKAWDCATGSGQAAVSLKKYFNQVIATDASSNQIHSAMVKTGITYKVAQAEKSGLESSTVDLISVAQALHWFNFDQFFAEVDRVLKSGGILAVWSYQLVTISSDMDKIIVDFYNQVLKGCWPPERIHIENNYANITFPFTKLNSKKFTMNTNWNLKQLIGYFSTWSAVKKYNENNAVDPLAKLTLDLLSSWGDPEMKRELCWPLNLILCQKPTN